MALQTMFRNFQVSYAHRRDWKTLRRCLHTTLPEPFARVLYRSAWVRREWKQEPHSWIYTATMEADQLFHIVSDVQSERARCVSAMQKK